MEASLTENTGLKQLHAFGKQIHHVRVRRDRVWCPSNLSRHGSFNSDQM